jgi:hypothetical protein
MPSIKAHLPLVFGGLFLLPQDYGDVSWAYDYSGSLGQ